jgi:translocation and assembly module TamB
MRFWMALLLVLLPATAFADAAADKDFITNWLEKNLSGAGRTITIDGFQGALSSQASLTTLTIADDKGVWLTLKDVTLDWSRAALLSGKIAVNELSAAEIDLDRLPSTQASTVPSAEAKPWALPDLPVSIAIKSILAKKIILGPTVLGQPVEATLTADANLANGEGTLHLGLERTGTGPQGKVTLSSSFANATQVLALSLDASEGAGGIVGTLLHVPGTPAASLTIEGKGPLSDFGAEVNLSTDGQTRLAGRLTQKDDAEGNRSFTADLSGDPTPVFLPEYASFFGPNVAIQLKGRRGTDGALAIDNFAVQAQALMLQGNMALAADGTPQNLHLTGGLGLPTGPVTLPIASALPIRVGHADLTLAYDKAVSDLWSFGMTASQFDTGNTAAGLVKLTAEGQLQDLLFNGTARFSVLSLLPRDPALAKAVGPTVTGAANFSWDKAKSALQIADLSLTAPGYRITSQGSIGGMADLEGTLTGHYDDLSRLASLTGRPLAGAVQFDLKGKGSPLSGIFDLDGTVTGTALGAGIAQLDQLLAGQSQLAFSVKRDETGTTIRNLGLQAKTLAVDLAGTLTSTGSDLKGTARFTDLSALGAAYRGSLTAKGSFTGTLASGQLSALAQGQDLAVGQPQADALLAGSSDLVLETTFADGVATLQKAQATTAHGVVAVTGTASAAHSDLKATLSLPDLSVMGAGYRGAVVGDATLTGTTTDGAVTLDVKGTDLGLGQPQADVLLRGSSEVSVKLALTPEGVRIDKADLGNAQIKASIVGVVQGNDRNLTLSAKLANVGLLYPQFPGAATLTGTAVQRADGTTLDISAQGPGQLDAKVKGAISANYKQADLSITGSATASLANAFIAPRSVEGALRFDLRLNGPLALSSLTGPVTISGGRLADPSQSFALQDLAATARFAGGRVQIDAKSAVTTGGNLTVTGGIGLAAPFNADLAIQLNQVGLKNPDLYETTVNGAVTFKGPARGGATIAGAIALGKTELRIPATGAGDDGNLPGLKHAHEPAAVRATRVRAGVGTSVSMAPPSRGYGLDIRISAPNQVFIRGRGLDAELGGSVVLKGATTNITPSGAFNLIRGRLDILGRRLVLSEAQIQMQGALVPYIRVVASVDSDGVTSQVVIEGDATDPTVTFTSSPSLPQEEVIARLLFNRGLENISAFQAAQLASAVATLAGRGGEGVLGSIRSKTGLDNLDVQADATGNASLTAGKYFSDKTYSEVTVDQSGKSTISLNYDAGRNVTLKAHVASDGATGAGVFLQKDY